MNERRTHKQICNNQMGNKTQSMKLYHNGDMTGFIA